MSSRSTNNAADGQGIAGVRVQEGQVRRRRCLSAELSGIIDSQNANGMQCGHDRCRAWWAKKGMYWCHGTLVDSPVVCVLSAAANVHLPPSCYPPNFLPLQFATVYLKKLNPVKKKITREHVLKSLGDEGRSLREGEMETKIKEFRDEAGQVVVWAQEEVKKRMLKVAAKLNVKVGGRAVHNFTDLKESWKTNGGEDNIGKFYSICHGDYEGRENQHWSRELEIEYMNLQEIKYDTEPSLREKGGYELCITHAKGNMVRQLMDRGKTTHMGSIALSMKKVGSKGTEGGGDGKQERRKEGEFFFKRRVSTLKEDEHAERGGAQFNQLHLTTAVPPLPNCDRMGSKK
jgi:hypothetical protein